MATETKNLGLTKAAGTEKYSIEVFNGNFDKVDEAIGELKEALGENSPIVTALEAIKSNMEADTSSAEIAEVKTLVDGNSDKLDAVDSNVENINSNVSGNGTKLDTLVNKADVISGQMQTVGNNVSSVKTTVENVGGKVDTAISLLNELKTALANANTNIATLLTQSNGVKAIVSGQITTPTTNPYKIDATIPDTMNAEKVVIVATAHSTASNVDSGIAWVRDGHTVTFAANNKVISYQFIEFY